MNNMENGDEGKAGDFTADELAAIWDALMQVIENGTRNPRIPSDAYESAPEEIDRIRFRRVAKTQLT